MLSNTGRVYEVSGSTIGELLFSTREAAENFAYRIVSNYGDYNVKRSGGKILTWFERTDVGYRDIVTAQVSEKRIYDY